MEYCFADREDDLHYLNASKNYWKKLEIEYKNNSITEIPKNKMFKYKNEVTCQPVEVLQEKSIRNLKIESSIDLGIMSKPKKNDCLVTSDTDNFCFFGKEKRYHIEEQNTVNLFFGGNKNPEVQQKNYQNKSEFSEEEYSSSYYQNKEDQTIDDFFPQPKHFEANEKKTPRKVNIKVGSK